MISSKNVFNGRSYYAVAQSGARCNKLGPFVAVSLTNGWWTILSLTELEPWIQQSDVLITFETNNFSPDARPTIARISRSQAWHRSLHVGSLLSLFIQCMLRNVDDHVDGVRQRLCTAATSRPVVHSTGDIWAWRPMVEWCRQGKTPDSSTIALWQSYCVI
jgi:hypothetical protein